MRFHLYKANMNTEPLICQESCSSSSSILWSLSPRRIWYSYPGQDDSAAAAAVRGGQIRDQCPIREELRRDPAVLFIDGRVQDPLGLIQLFLQFLRGDVFPRRPCCPETADILLVDSVFRSLSGLRFLPPIHNTAVCAAVCTALQSVACRQKADPLHTAEAIPLRRPAPVSLHQARKEWTPPRNAYRLPAPRGCTLR